MSKPTLLKAANGTTYLPVTHVKRTPSGSSYERTQLKRLTFKPVPARPTARRVRRDQTRLQLCQEIGFEIQIVGAKLPAAS